MQPSTSRRALLAASAVAVALSFAAAPAHAQSGKTVRILVGFPAGGGTDALARLLADRL